MAQQQQCKCDLCTKDFDDVYYCTKCNDDVTNFKYLCEECSTFLHKRNDDPDHKFGKNKSYIKSGRNLLYENKNMQVVKKAYQKRLAQALPLYLKDKSEECLAKIRKELCESDFAKLVPTVASQVISVATDVGVAAATHAEVFGALALPGLSYAGLCILEVGWAGLQLGRGKITAKEFWIQTGKSVINCSAGAGGSIAGFLGGAAIGSLGGPIGAVIGGIIGAVAGGILSYKFADYKYAEKGGNALWDWLSKKYPSLCDDDEKQKKSLIKAALKEFGIENVKSKQFNKEYVKGKYRELAKVWHPDRKLGSKAKFQEISGYYGMLMAILENGKDKEEQEATIEMIQAITL